MELQERIESFVESTLPDPSVFIVQIKLAMNAKGRKVSVFLDGDQGVSIDQCASVSRQLGALIEEAELIDGAYNLEVSSPGVDQPLRFLRQYPQHIGRKMVVMLVNGEELIGTLQAVEGDNLLFEQEIKVKGKKKVELQDATLAFNDVKEASIKLPF